MPWFFAASQVDEPFRMFSVSHLSALALVAAFLWFLYAKREVLRLERHSKMVRRALAALLLACEGALQLWYLTSSGWHAAYALPLHLCSITLLLSVVVLLTRNAHLYEVLYFAGVGGAVQALLTPELYYPFPHFRFFHFFLATPGLSGPVCI